MALPRYRSIQLLLLKNTARLQHSVSFMMLLP